MREAVWINSNDNKILGILEYDDSFRNRGQKLVLFIHGFVGTKVEPHRMYKKLSDRLCNLGYTVLRFDFVGSGDSDGKFEDMTIDSEVQDGINVINYCKEKYNYKEIYILGYSMGGCVASILASMIRSDGLVLWSPVSNPFWNFHHIIGDEKFRMGLEGEEIDYFGDMVGQKFFQNLMEVDPLKALRSYQKPVLIIHGTKDTDVFPINGYNYYKNLVDSKLYYVKDADHCYSKREFETELLDKTEEYFQKYR